MSTFAKIRRELADLSRAGARLRGPSAVAGDCDVRRPSATARGRPGTGSGSSALPRLRRSASAVESSFAGALTSRSRCLPAVFAAVLFGPVAAMIVFAASVVRSTDAARGPPHVLSESSAHGRCGSTGSNRRWWLMSGGARRGHRGVDSRGACRGGLDAALCDQLTSRLRGNGR